VHNCGAPDPAKCTRPSCVYTYMNDRHRLVVSAENGAYHAWQCKLFHYSSVTRLKHQPIFIVHANGRPWHPDFLELIRAGAIVRTSPSYISHNGIPTRNCPGSLLEAVPLLRSDEIIVLCDPDLVFVSQVELPSTLAASYYSYMDYEAPAVYAAARKLGVGKKMIQDRQPTLVCGTPYIIPVDLATRIGLAWLRAYDCFTIEGREDSNWMDVMYAFGLALLCLDLPITMFDAVNVDMPSDCMLSRRIIHYGMGSVSWDKRSYLEDETISKVWNPPFTPAKGTVLYELFSQLRSARQFYQDIYKFRADSCTY